MLAVLLANAWHWALQVFLLVGVTGLALGVLRVHDARIRLRVWHAVVIIALLLPLLQTWQPLETRGGDDAPIHVGTAIAWPVWIAAALIAGVVLRAGWLVVGLFKLRRLRRLADPWRPLPEWYDGIERAIGASAVVEISAGVDSAVTFGLRQPAILVSRTLPAAPHTHQRAVLAHELVHVARRDWLWVLGEEAVRTALWCHPAIWFALGEAQLAREEVVDRRAIAATGNHQGYLEALVAAAGPAPAAALGFGPQFYRRRQLEIRIRRLLKENVMSTTRLIAMAAVLAVMVPVTVLAGGRAFPLVTKGDAIQQVPPPPPPPPPPAPPAPAAPNQTAPRVAPPPPPPPPAPRSPAARSERAVPPPPPTPPTSAVRGGVANGIKGGVAGGVTSGVESGSPPPPPAPPAPPAAIKKNAPPPPPPPPPAPPAAIKKMPPPPAPPPPGKGRGGAH